MRHTSGGQCELDTEEKAMFEMSTKTTMGVKHGRDSPFRHHGQQYMSAPSPFLVLPLCANAPISEGVVQRFQEVLVGRGPAQFSSDDASDVQERVFQVSLYHWVLFFCLLCRF